MQTCWICGGARLRPKTRSRNAGAHVAFRYGEHFCLGAQLARMEARIAFAALLARFARWELAGAVQRLPSVFMRGVVRLPLRLSA